MSDTTDRSKQLVQEFYASAASGDGAALAACVHDDFELEEPTCLPYGGTYQGLNGLQAALARVAAVLDFDKLEVESMVADGEQVVVTLRVGVQGSDALVRNAEHWTVRDGKVWRGRVFTFDPSPVLAAAGAPGSAFA
ncbi:MAG TPA: nuclear transport factor 2 family protein [Baekduia sp.]|nr:nuclear transport factor 2 family protein [Baekduia sp.]